MRFVFWKQENKVEITWSVLVAASLAILATVVAAFASNGNVLMTLVPTLLIVGGIGFVMAPLHVSAAIFLFAVLLFEDVRARPNMGEWHSPLMPVGRLLYDALDKTIPIPGFKIFGLELILLVLLVATWLKRRLGARRPVPPLGIFTNAVVCSVFTIIAWEVWGTLRGGDVRFSMLQMRPILFTPLAALLFANAFQSLRSLRTVLFLFLAAGLIRAGFGLYFWKVIMPTLQSTNLEIGGGNYIMSHHDTVLWVVCLMICVVLFFHYSRPSTLLLSIVICAPIGVAVVANNRRLAIVALVLATLIFYFLSNQRVQAKINRLLLASVPVGLLYIAVGWNSGGMWARPIQVIKSIAKPKDFSADMRDIENYNLVATGRHSPVLGMGMGHGYDEQIKAIDITEFLQAYLYLPHNSLLWALTALGLVGFTLYWMIYVVTVFLAVRMYRASELVTDQVIAIVAIIAIMTYGIQAFGDLGLLSWLPNVIVSAFVGVVGGRATQLGVWPARGLSSANSSF